MSGGVLPIAALVMQTAGSIAGGIGANSEAKAAARVDEENARLSLLAGEQDVAAILRDERMMAGEALAQLGGMGGGIGMGSAADIIAESAMQRDRDILIQRSKAAAESRNYLQAAKDKRAAGKAALIGSAFSTVAGVLSGVSDIRAGRRGEAARQSVRAAQSSGSAGIRDTGQRSNHRLPLGGSVLLPRTRINN